MVWDPHSLEQMQTNLTLSYVVGVGQNTQDPTSDIVYREILVCLNKSKMTADRFSIVWGPAVYVDSEFAANVTMVVKNEVDPNDYRVVTSGTSANSIFDIFSEDFGFYPTTPFTDDPECPSSAYISTGTATGLKKIFETAPSISPTNFLVDFLKTLPKGSNITVTGHSLGGVLASTLALSLMYKLKDSNVNIYCHAFAGPTAGNDVFANYSDMKLKGRLLRIWNTLDIVPRAWNEKDLKSILTLYPEKTYPVPDDVSNFINQALATIEEYNLNYTQLGLKDTSLQNKLTGKINYDIQGFGPEAGYQHIVAYIELLGLKLGDIDLTLIQPRINNFG